MERLGQLDHAAGVAREDFRVDVAHGGHAHDFDPRLVFAEDVEHLLLVDVRVEPFGCRAQGQGDVEAVVVGLDGEQPGEARRGGQGAVEVALGVAERVEVAVKARTGVEQGDFVVEALLGIAGADFAGEHLRAAYRQILRHQFAHAPRERGGLFGGEFVDALDLAVESVLAHRVADVERLPREKVADGFLEDEPRRPLVDADAREGGDVHEADGHRGIYFVVELLDAVVDVGRQERIPARRQFRGHLGQRRAHRHLERGAEIFADDGYGVCHGFMLNKMLNDG